MYLAGFTIIAASLVALRSDNLKRRLAYSTVSQLSYIVLAVAVLAPLSVAAAALHVATHAVGKITLFFAAGAIYTASGKTEVSQLDGIGRRMPWTMAAFAVGALSLIGIPPAAGFLSKWLMFQGAAGAGNWTVLAVLGASTLLNAAYFLPIVHAAFFRPLPGGDAVHGEAPWTMVAALTFTAAATILLPFMNAVPLALARMLARRRALGGHMTEQGKRYWLDRPENVARLYRALWIVGGLLALLDLVCTGMLRPASTGGLSFYALYGFVACVALVLAAKVLRRVVMRPEDFYDR